MKRFWIVWMAAGIAGVSSAGMTATTGGRESLLETESISPWTVGVDYEHQVRPMRGSLPFGARMDTDAISALIGVRLFPWLAPFGTVGKADTVLGAWESDGDLRWSAGLQVNLWQQDILDPSFMEGRISLRGIGEYIHTDFGADACDADWHEWTASLLLGYEIFTGRPDQIDRSPYSLTLYAGPTLSRIEGDFAAGATSSDFESEDEIAVTVGVELFIAHNLSVGGAVQAGDETSWRAGARLHF